MFFKEYSEEALAQIISSLLGGEKFAAISQYKELSKLGSEDVLLDVIAINRIIVERLSNSDDAFFKAHVPEKC